MIGPHPDHAGPHAVDRDLVATAESIAALAPGSVVPNCFGQLRRVTEVTAVGTTTKGLAFACFAQEWGEHSTMTHSATEGRRWSNF